jgi:hypothetical protein
VDKELAIFRRLERIQVVTFIYAEERSLSLSQPWRSYGSLEDPKDPDRTAGGVGSRQQPHPRPKLCGSKFTKDKPLPTQHSSRRGTASNAATNALCSGVPQLWLWLVAANNVNPHASEFGAFWPSAPCAACTSAELVRRNIWLSTVHSESSVRPPRSIIAFCEHG